MKKIETLEPLVTKPSQAEDLTVEDIGEYLYWMTNKLNEVIDVINKKNQADKIPVDYQDRDDI